MSKILLLQQYNTHLGTFNRKKDKETEKKKECIPVGCVLPAHNCMGISPTDPHPPDIDPTWTETPPLERDTPG